MRVGTSHFIVRKITQAWDHPHACGDKKFMKQYLIATSGSSPCVWGQESSYRSCQEVLWIIPMRVGTRNAVTNTTLFARDHPHACGDKISERICGCIGEGSSPCVWGQGRDLKQSDFSDGIIPMRVGTRAVRER